MDKMTRRFIYFIISIGVFRFIYIAFLPITPQEAYYWYYAKYPALSYFDHPPVTAYSIWLGTFLFGDTLFGVKFMAVIWSLLTNLALFFTTKEAHSGDEQQKGNLAFAVVVVFNLTVFAHMYAMLAVPDTALMFFWIATLFCFQRALQKRGNYYWLLSGLTMGFGLLSKYTAIALLPALVVILIIFPEQRHWFKSVYPYLALLIMMIVFWPVICWNQSNNWASLQFQFSERAARTKPFQVKYFLQLLASQLALLTPLIFFWFIRLSNDIKKVWHKNRTVLFYFISGIFLIGGFILISLKSQVKMNWLMPGYLGLIIALVLFYHSSINIRSLSAKIAAAFSIVLIITAYLLPMVPNVPIGEGNTWSGWSDAAKKIYNYQQEKGGNEKCFIFANSYKSASLLKFYLPGQQDTYAENIYNRPALQFDIWGTPQQLKGKDALFVFTDRKEYKNDIKYVQPFFDSLELFQEFEYKFAGKLHTRTIYCYYAKNYHGKN